MVPSTLVSRRPVAAISLLFLLVAASCGSSDTATSAQTTTTSPTTTAPTTTAPTTTTTEVVPTTAATTTAAPDAVTAEDGAPTEETTSTALGAADAGECPVWDGALGQSTMTYRHRDVDREVVVHVPQGPDLSEPMPVVFNFHGLGGRGESQMAGTQFGPLADRDGWLVVAPDGVDNPRRWPLEGFDGPEPASLDFVDGLIEWVADSWCIDRGRLYATGFSYGGLMTSALACQRSNTFAAFAPAGATVHLPSLCEDANPVSLLSFHGTADQVVTFDGSPTLLDPNGLVGDIAENVAAWAAQSGCDGSSDTVVVEPTSLRSWTCPTGVEIGIHIIEGGAHEWPRPATAGIDASDVIWDFFSRHP